MLHGDNHYAILGISRDATPEEIRSAYFNAARRLHPDTNPDPSTLELFLRIQEAYETLSNPERKAAYDAMLPVQDLTTPAISHHIYYSRPSLSYLDEPQLVYAMVDMTSVPDPGVSVTSPMNLCLVLDRSTSMHGSRMDMVKANVIELLQNLKPQDIISIVVYSDRAEVLIPSTRVSDVNRLHSKINQIQTSGGTEIYQGLKAGIEQIRANISPLYINHLILMTDGRTYGDEAQSLDLAEQAGRDGICISGLGFGSEWNDHFLDKLVGLSGGSTMYVSTPQDLRQLLSQKYAHLSKVYAERVVFDFQLSGGVELNYVLRIQPEVGILPTALPIRAGNIPQYNTLRILFEFLVHPIKRNVTLLNLAQGFIKFEIPTRAIPANKLRFNLSLAIREQIDEEPPPQVIIKCLSLLTLYRMQDAARQDVENKNPTAAVKKLQRLASQLVARGERDLAHIVLTEAEEIKKTNQFTQDGDKRIKYQTRALFLPAGGGTVHG